MSKISEIAGFAKSVLNAAGKALKDPKFIGTTIAGHTITIGLESGGEAIATYIGDLKDEGHVVGKVYKLDNGNQFVKYNDGTIHNI